MKKFTAQWFQDVTGRYLSIDESFNSIKTIETDCLENAIQNFAEMENEDSEIPFTDRVLVKEVK